MHDVSLYQFWSGWNPLAIKHCQGCNVFCRHADDLPVKIWLIPWILPFCLSTYLGPFPLPCRLGKWAAKGLKTKELPQLATPQPRGDHAPDHGWSHMVHLYLYTFSIHQHIWKGSLVLDNYLNRADTSWADGHFLQGPSGSGGDRFSVQFSFFRVPQL